MLRFSEEMTKNWDDWYFVMLAHVEACFLTLFFLSDLKHPSFSSLCYTAFWTLICNHSEHLSVIILNTLSYIMSCPTCYGTLCTSISPFFLCTGISYLHRHPYSLFTPPSLTSLTTISSFSYLSDLWTHPFLSPIICCSYPLLCSPCMFQVSFFCLFQP